ncbi:hypothetical protein H9P43_000141 [Blastocladiella emersonii ATCC 22665]|nr:hypothetical protein H9P43_000141 [Blastocladiella emersonii ATCC 22665]
MATWAHIDLEPPVHMTIAAPVQCPALGTHLYTVAPNGSRTEPKLVKFSCLLAALALAILYPVDQADGLWHFGLLSSLKLPLVADTRTLELVVNRLGFAAALFTDRNFDALIPLLMGCGSVPIISNDIERFSVTDALEVFSELDKRYLTWAIPKLTNGDLTLRSLPRPLLTFTTDKDPRNGVPVEQVGGSKFKFGVLLFHRQSGKTVVQFVHDMLQESGSQDFRTRAVVYQIHHPKFHGGKIPEPKKRIQSGSAPKKVVEKEPAAKEDKGGRGEKASQ